MPDGGRPTGTLTFLFTDIEGSTRLLQEDPDVYPTVVETQRRLIREASDRHGGFEFGTEGDALFVAFVRAADGVAAAVEAQLAIARHVWPGSTQLRVRMALHTGEVTVVDDDYVGLALHVTARVCDATHGGQTMLTAAVQQLAHDVPVVDLGAHTLRDVRETVRLFSVAVDGLPTDFPPPRTLTSLPNNLPHPTDEFVGREREVVEVVDMLSDHRLVTILGPGGSGKTRLAIEAAAVALPVFPDGVWFVEARGSDRTRPSRVGVRIRAADR